MTVFDKIKGMDINQFAEWFVNNCAHEDDPSALWWAETYCENCEPEMGRYVGGHRDVEFSWCEIHNKCRYFNDYNHLLDDKEVVLLWLKSEAK